MAEEQDLLHKLWGFVEPGGDVDGIRRAAEACRKLSADLTGVVNGLDPVATGLRKKWQGPSGEGFQKAWTSFDPGVLAYTKHLVEAADGLDKVADMIHEAQVQARNFKIACAATVAVGAALTVFTFGFSDAAAAAPVEAEGTALAVMMARLAALLAGEAEAVSALFSTMAVVAERFALGIAFSAAATVLVKGVFEGENVLDPANYSIKDATKTLFDAWLFGGMGALAGTGTVSAALEAHPVLGFGAFAGSASGIFSGLSQFWLNGESLAEPNAWLNVAKGTGVGTVSGLSVGGASLGLPKLLGFLREAGAPGVEDPILSAGEIRLTEVLGPDGLRLRLDGIEELPAPRTLFGPDGEPLADAPPAGAGPLPGPGGRPLFPPQSFPLVGITPGDIIRDTAGVVSGALNYLVNFPDGTPPVTAPEPPSRCPPITFPCSPYHRHHRHRTYRRCSPTCTREISPCIPATRCGRSRRRSTATAASSASSPMPTSSARRTSSSPVRTWSSRRCGTTRICTAASRSATRAER